MLSPRIGKEERKLRIVGPAHKKSALSDVIKSLDNEQRIQMLIRQKEEELQNIDSILLSKSAIFPGNELHELPQKAYKSPRQIISRIKDAVVTPSASKILPKSVVLPSIDPMNSVNKSIVSKEFEIRELDKLLRSKILTNITEGKNVKKPSPTMKKVLTTKLPKSEEFPIRKMILKDRTTEATIKSTKNLLIRNPLPELKISNQNNDRKKSRGTIVPRKLFDKEPNIFDEPSIDQLLKKKANELNYIAAYISPNFITEDNIL